MNTLTSLYKLSCFLSACLLLSSCNNDDYYDYTPQLASAIFNDITIELYDYSTTRQESKAIEVYGYLENACKIYSEELLTGGEELVVRSIKSCASLPDVNDMEVIEEGENHLESIGTATTRFSVGNQSVDLFCTFKFSFSCPPNVDPRYYYGGSSISIIKIECNGVEADLYKEASQAKFKLNLNDTGFSVE